MKILITGGAGFIGSALVRHIIRNTDHKVLNIDKLTYAGNLSSIEEVNGNPRYFFEKLDINDTKKIKDLIFSYKPDFLMNLAAESHVDRSISGPSEFIKTNILGTYSLLQASLDYYQEKVTDNNFRFHHISTDEVYGDLGYTKKLFTEETPYSPSSPYSASKASSDHLVRSWFRTFGLPILITNCSNNYGPYHFPEKLIPKAIINALRGESISIYGDGKQIRDWLYVDDHVKALLKVAIEGKVGETYNIGGHNEKTNIEVVRAICEILEELCPKKPDNVYMYEDLINYVGDRPGHDLRYAIDATKIKNDLGWTPNETFNSGLKKTVEWYVNNTKWWEEILNKT